MKPFDSNLGWSDLLTTNLICLWYRSQTTMLCDTCYSSILQAVGYIINNKLFVFTNPVQVRLVCLCSRNEAVTEVKETVKERNIDCERKI